MVQTAEVLVCCCVAPLEPCCLVLALAETAAAADAVVVDADAELSCCCR